VELPSIIELASLISETSLRSEVEPEGAKRALRYGGYSRDFQPASRTLPGMLGYRALSVDCAQQDNGRHSGFNAVLHGPAAGFVWRF
jgi:hypothetical protein